MFQTTNQLYLVSFGLPRSNMVQTQSYHEGGMRVSGNSRKETCHGLTRSMKKHTICQLASSNIIQTTKQSEKNRW